MAKNKLGQWAVWLGIIFVALMALSLIVAFVIGGDSSVIESNPWLLVAAMVLNAGLNLSGLLSLILGVITLIKYKEWRVAKLLGIVYGLTIVLFLLGEFIFPH